MSISKQKELFLNLVRVGIGKESTPYIINRVQPNKEDWEAIQALAEEQGLTAVVLDGIDKASSLSSTIPTSFKLDWIGQVLQNYEQRYELYEKTHAEMATFYNQHGFQMMVLKGYACSLDWYKPEHRPCGDIDIWQFGKQVEADEALAKEKGIKIDFSHHHHTVFEWDGFEVENHYDFINVHHHKSNVAYEAILKELGKDDSHYVEVDGERIYLPSPNLHALFLLKHLMMHFASEGMMLRQLLDWGFFVEKHTKEIDWEYVLKVLDRFGMKKMFDILNAICVGDFGFNVELFPSVQFNPSLKDKVLNELLSPQFDVNPPDVLIRRLIFKVRRWKGNEWKHKLCYKDSLWSAFWSGVWNHLLKPSSI